MAVGLTFSGVNGFGLGRWMRKPGGNWDWEWVGWGFWSEDWLSGEGEMGWWGVAVELVSSER